MHKWFAAATAILLSSGSGVAQEMPYGQAEYLNSCAACHGPRGKGNGALAETLRVPPADLTQLEKKNGGEFPYFRVYAVIDGRFVVPGHGERDMPVWGRQFLDEDVQVYGPNGGEIVAQERIHELAGYIQTLQQ
ncbi:MAG: c-type cytochrome [Mesorhizobium sp.]|nr:c-type cytochrome [Mesorhizobium sp.]